MPHVALMIENTSRSLSTSKIPFITHILQVKLNGINNVPHPHLIVDIGHRILIYTKLIF